MAPNKITFTFRQAIPADSPLAGELILMTMGELGEVIFGLDSRPRAIQALGKLFTYPNNRYSYTKTIIAEVEGQVAGMLLSFRGIDLNRLQLPLLYQMLAVYSTIDMLRLFWRAIPLMEGSEAEKDEFHIAHTAVLPQYQGLGLGRKFMALAEEQCRLVGLLKCSLCVDFGHDVARQLYLKLGYRIVESHTNPPHIAQRLKWGGYERMLKDI